MDVWKTCGIKRPEFRRWFSRRKKRLTVPLQSLWRWGESAWPAALVLAIMLACLGTLWRAYHGFGEIQQGIYIEAWGTALDILVVGFFLTLLSVGRERKEKKNRYLEEINDFKKWDNEEARLRIAGNIKRLADLGKTDIDFSGIILRDFSFQSHDIYNLSCSTFSQGLHWTLSKNATTLENVDFANVDCSDVVFSKKSGNFSGFGLIGKNLGFYGTKLCGACFDGAVLTWTEYIADKTEWSEDAGEDDEGRPMEAQTYFPAFAGADLKGCSFQYTRFDHADFRDAENILEANFQQAEGLDTCFFDEEVREQILVSARSSSSR